MGRRYFYHMTDGIALIVDRQGRRFPVQEAGRARGALLRPATHAGSPASDRLVRLAGQRS
jgi:hypothetical protein